MKPVKATRDHRVTSASENFFHFVVFDMPKELTRHLIEKSTRKGGHKKIADAINLEREKDRDKDRLYSEGLRSSGYKRYNTAI